MIAAQDSTCEAQLAVVEDTVGLFITVLLTLDVLIAKMR